MTLTATRTHTSTRTVRNLDGERVRVSMTLTDVTGTYTTTGHSTVTGTYTRVSFQGEVFARHSSHPYAVGQVQDSLTGPEGALIREVWDRWHLNDMHAHCEHQPRTLRWDAAPECALTGYRAGSSWLVEPLTTAGYDRIVALFS